MRYLILPVLLTLAVLPVSAQHGLPDWAASAVWYQIFPERFENGDTLNDPVVQRVEQQPAGWRKSSWTSDWYARDAWEKSFHDEFHWSVTKRRYGGDLQGIINRLDHLKELGVTALYINPVFDAVSMHKYDGASFHHIDRHFGPDPEGDGRIIDQESLFETGVWRFTEADKLFLKLIEEVHRRKMRIIIDGVFNHTGREFWAFRDVVKQQERSPFKAWYDIKKFDDPKTPENEFDYAGWIGIKSLPEFKEERGNLAAPVKDHLFTITSRWMDPNGDGDPSDGIDGWRLDVAAEVGLLFWKEWNAYVKSINPEAVTIAEIWDEKARPYTLYGGFDGVMNYRWTRLTDAFFVTRKMDADAFIAAQQTLLADLKAETNFRNMNLLESHDTERWVSRYQNTDRAFKEKSGYRDGFDIRKPSPDAFKQAGLARFFQFTYVGAPMVYYGAEAGMWGGDDPDNRKPMVWPDKSYQPEQAHPVNLFRSPDSVFYDRKEALLLKSLITMRGSDPVFQTGNIFFITPAASPDVLAFIRTDDLFRLVLVVIHRGGGGPVTVELPRTVRISSTAGSLGKAAINRRRNHIIISAGTADIVYLERRP